jgi:cephalosporin hydroxylase
MSLSLQTWVDVDASMGVWRTGGHEQQHRGLRMWKTVDDLDRYRKVIADTAPEVLVETGTRWGGSAVWFADLGLEVVTVDIDQRASQDARGRSDRITWVESSSIDRSAVAEVSEVVAGRRCMVSLDSDHHASHVATEIESYAPLVTAGCYLVVEDGLGDLAGAAGQIMGRRIPTEGGPLAAIEATVARWPGWTRDVEIERMSPVTHHPAGFWRRDG